VLELYVKRFFFTFNPSSIPNFFCVFFGASSAPCVNCPFVSTGRRCLGDPMPLFLLSFPSPSRGILRLCSFISRVRFLPLSGLFLFHLLSPFAFLDPRPHSGTGGSTAPFYPNAHLFPLLLLVGFPVPSSLTLLALGGPPLNHPPRTVLPPFPSLIFFFFFSSRFCFYWFEQTVPSSLIVSFTCPFPPSLLTFF